MGSSYTIQWYSIATTRLGDSDVIYFYKLEIKPCELLSRIWDMEAFWYKTEIKIIYFVPLCFILLIVYDCIAFFIIKNLWPG